MKRLVATLALALSTTASAQYTGPSPPASGYVGPDTIPAMTARQLIDGGRDDQYVRLQGNLVSRDGGQHYTFADASGRVSVEISGNKFPVGQPIGPDQRVELLVEVDKDVLGTEFEVEQVRVLP